MFDIFTKSKIEPAAKTSVPELDRLPGLEGAWRIAYAIDHALRAAETERESLAGRVEDATAWAAVSLGNGNDEYLERELLDTQHLNRFDTEIRDGNKQVIRLERSIAHYRLLKATLLAGFPELGKKDGVVGREVILK